MKTVRKPRPTCGSSIPFRQEFIIALIISLAAFSYALAGNFNDFESEDVALVQGTAANITTQSGAILFRLREHSKLFAVRPAGIGSTNVTEALLAAGKSETKVWFRKTDPFSVVGAVGRYHLVTAIVINGDSIVDEARVRRHAFTARAQLVVLGLGVWLFYGVKVARRPKQGENVG